MIRTEPAVEGVQCSSAERLQMRCRIGAIQMKGGFKAFLAVAVDQEECERAVVIPDSCTVEIRDIFTDGAIVAGHCDLRQHGYAPAIQRGAAEGLIDRLNPGAAAGLGHDRSDDVDELGQARDPDPVSIPKQRIHHASGDQRIHIIEKLFLNGSAHGPLGRLQAGLPEMVPHVPLIKGEGYIVAAVLRSPGLVTDGADLPDAVLHLKTSGEKAGNIVRLIGVILMQGNIVNMGIAVRQNGFLPCAEVGMAR